MCDNSYSHRKVWPRVLNACWLLARYFSYFNLCMVVNKLFCNVRVTTMLPSEVFRTKKQYGSLLKLESQKINSPTSHRCTLWLIVETSDFTMHTYIQTRDELYTKKRNERKILTCNEYAYVRISHMPYDKMCVQRTRMVNDMWWNPNDFTY